MNYLKIKVSGVKCLMCGDTIYSRANHDIRWCTCGQCYVDGGPTIISESDIDKDYSRVGWTVKDKTLSVVEIKPRNLRNSEDVLLKEEAGIQWCKERDLEYKIICDDEFEKLSQEEIRLLHDNGEIRFIDRYEEKYKLWVKKLH